MFSNVESYRRCSAVFQRITVASRLCSSASRQSHGDLMAWAVPMPCAWRTALCSVSSAQQVEQLDVQSQPRRHFRLKSFFFNSLFLTKIAIIARDYFKIICVSQIFLSICESSCVSFVYGIGCSNDSLPLTPSNKQCTACTWWLSLSSLQQNGTGRRSENRRRDCAMNPDSWQQRTLCWCPYPKLWSSGWLYLVFSELNYWLLNILMQF